MLNTDHWRFFIFCHLRWRVSFRIPSPPPPSVIIFLSRRVQTSVWNSPPDIPKRLNERDLGKGGCLSCGGRRGGGGWRWGKSDRYRRGIRAPAGSRVRSPTLARVRDDDDDDVSAERFVVGTRRRRRRRDPPAEHVACTRRRLRPSWMLIADDVPAAFFRSKPTEISTKSLAHVRG